VSIRKGDGIVQLEEVETTTGEEEERTVFQVMSPQATENHSALSCGCVFGYVYLLNLQEECCRLFVAGVEEHFISETRLTRLSDLI